MFDIGKMTATLMGHAFRSIIKERRRQDEQWGGPGVDDTRTADDWNAFIEKRASEILLADDPKNRERFVRIAALAVAAIESIDRAKARASGCVELKDGVAHVRPSGGYDGLNINYAASIADTIKMGGSFSMDDPDDDPDDSTDSVAKTFKGT